MKPIAYIFPITAAVVFVELILGAVAVLDLYNVRAHTSFGWVTGFVVLVAMIVALASKPKLNPLRYSSAVLFVLVVLQGLLGSIGETSEGSFELPAALVAVHFAVSLLIWGGSVALVFQALRWGRMESATTR